MANSKNSDPETDIERTKLERVDQKSLLILLFLMLSGVVVGFFYSLQSTNWNSIMGSFATSLAVSGAALLSGGFLGLLFGIPRRLQGDNQRSHDNRADKEQNPAESAEALYIANTNLEQISDWLTKILVGVGLTQISHLDDILTGIGKYAGRGFGDIPSADVFAVCIFVFFLVDGFLIGYLWTRLYLGRALTLADRAASLRKRLSEVERQTASDARWLQLGTRQLREEQPVPQDQLNKAAIAASPAARAQIFYMAANQRADNWKEDFRKPQLEKTIPIFRALIASDKSNKYHANYGQLGFALKEQRNPDWAGAEHELSKAIALRGDPLYFGYCEYEAVRAMCLIQQDQNFQKGKKSDPAISEKISKDLTLVNQFPDVAKWVMEDEAILEWCGINDYKG